MFSSQILNEVFENMVWIDSQGNTTISPELRQINY